MAIAGWLLWRNGSLLAGEDGPVLFNTYEEAQAERRSMDTISAVTAERLEELKKNAEEKGQ